MDETIPIERLEPPFCPDVFERFFASMGELLAVWLDEGNVIKILEHATWKEKTACRQDRVTRCRFFPDGKTLLIETTSGFHSLGHLKGQASGHDGRIGATERQHSLTGFPPMERELKAVEHSRTGRKGKTGAFVEDRGSGTRQRGLCGGRHDDLARITAEFEIAPRRPRCLPHECRDDRIKIEEVETGCLRCSNSVTTYRRSRTEDSCGIRRRVLVRSQPQCSHHRRR